MAQRTAPPSRFPAVFSKVEIFLAERFETCHNARRINDPYLEPRQTPLGPWAPLPVATGPVTRHHRTFKSLRLGGDSPGSPRANRLQRITELEISMNELCSLSPCPLQSSLHPGALPLLNSKHNRIPSVFATAFAALALFGAAAHAQAPDLAAGAPPNRTSQLPAGFTGATPLQVMNGQAILVGRLAPTQKLRLVVGLRPPHMAEEEAFLAQLQMKGSPNFHKYLTPQQWNTRFAPSAADEQSVVEWAQSQGLTVTQRYPNRLIVDLEGTSDVIEKAFAVHLNQYKVGVNVEFSNDRDPFIPGNLTGIIRSVGGLNSIARVHAQHEGNIQNSPIYSPMSVTPNGPALHHNGSRAAYQAAMKASA
jgi:hypothetical protein